MRDNAQSGRSEDFDDAKILGAILEHDESAQLGMNGSATASGVKTSATLAVRVLLAGAPASVRSAFGIRPMTTMAAKGPNRHQRHARDIGPRLRANSRGVPSGADEGAE